MQLEMMAGQAKIQQTQSDAKLKDAQTIKTLTEAGQPPEGQQMPEPQPFELPPDVQIGKALAETDSLHAKADHTRAQAFKTTQEATLAPIQHAQQAFDNQADRDQRDEQAKLAAKTKAKTQAA